MTHHDPADPVVAHVNMFRARVVLVSAIGDWWVVASLKPWKTSDRSLRSHKASFMPRVADSLQHTRSQ